MIYINDEERQILRFLQTCPEHYFSAQEICKKASTRKKYAATPRWALRPLQSLLEKGLVDRDAGGHFRFLKEE